MKDRDNGKGKLWEKRRRDRLKEAFQGLGQLLPHYDPAKIIPQQEILDRATQFIKELRLSNSRIITQQTQADEKSKLIQELQDEVNKLILRVRQLTVLLNQANISIPAGPCLKLLGKRKLKWSDKLVADDGEPQDKRQSTNTEDIETTKENEKESSTSQSDVGNNINGTMTSAPLRETNGCSITSIVDGDKEISDQLSTPSTTTSIPVSLPLQISSESSPSIQNSITLKPVTFTIQNTPTTTIFLTPHSLTPISTMVPLTTRITIPPHRILPKPNNSITRDKSTGNEAPLPKLPIVRVTQPIPVVKKKRRRRRKNSTSETTNSTTIESEASQMQDLISISIVSTESSTTESSPQSASSSNEIVQSTPVSESLTLVYEPQEEATLANSNDSDETIHIKNIPKSTGLTSEIDLAEENSIANDQLETENSSCNIETVTISENERDVEKVLIESKELKTSNQNNFTTAQEEEQRVEAIDAKVNGTPIENQHQSDKIILNVIHSIKPTTATTESTSSPSCPDDQSKADEALIPTIENEAVQPELSSVSIMTPVENNVDELKPNFIESSPVKDYLVERCEPLSEATSLNVEDKFLNENPSMTGTENNPDTVDEESSIEPQPGPIAHPVAANEIDMTNSDSNSLQEIVDNLMEGPQVSSQRQLQANRNNEDTLSSVGISTQSEEVGSVSNEKISECIARSIGLIDQPEEAELMELSGDWGETDVNSPKSPISPTQMFLSMFPLLPRDSIISSSEATQNTQQQVHKNPTNFTSVKSSNFYIDSMLPETDEFNRNSIPVTASAPNSVALISSHTNCNNTNSYITTSNLLSLANTSSDTDTLKTTSTCLAMIPPTSKRRTSNTENSENINPFSFQLPASKSTITTAITTQVVSSGNKNMENHSNSSLKNNSQGFTDVDRNQLLTLTDPPNGERITDLDSNFPIFSSSFMNNLTHVNSSLSCPNKTPTSNLCSLNSHLTSNNNNGSNQRHRKELEIGNWTPYEYPSYSMASITNNTNAKNTTDTSMNNFSQSSSIRHSTNSISNNNNNVDHQNKQNHHQLFRSVFDSSIPNTTTTTTKSTNNKACTSSVYNISQKNSQHVNSVVVSSMNSEPNQQPLQNVNTHTYKPYMQNFHSQSQSHSSHNFNIGSNNNSQNAQMVQPVESSIPPLSMYGGSSMTSATEYHKNHQQQQQLDLFRPLSVPTSTDFHHHQHHVQQSSTSNNHHQSYSQHNVLHSTTSLNVNLTPNSNASSNNSSHQPKSQHTSKSQNSRSSSRSQGERNNNNNSTGKTPSSFSSSSTSSTSRPTKTTSSMPLHSPYSSQFPNTSTSTIGQRELQYVQVEKSTPSSVSRGRSGSTKPTGNQNIQNCSRSTSSSNSNSKRNYQRTQSQSQNNSLISSNQNSMQSSLALDFPPPPPPPPPSSTNFVMGNNNFYENILPQPPASHTQFSIGHHHSKSGSSRHQPFYLPDVPVQNFDFMQAHTIAPPPINSSVPIVPPPPLPLPPPVITPSLQHTQKNTLTSSSTHRSSQSSTHKGTTTPYNYFSAPQCSPRGYPSTTPTTLNNNNNKNDSVMTSLIDTHNNSVYGSSSTSQSQQQHLPTVQNQLTQGPSSKKTVQNQSQQQVYQNSHNNNNSSSQHSHSHQQQQGQSHSQPPNSVNNLQSVPSSRPVNWMTDPLPQVPSCNRKTGENSSTSSSTSSSIPNPFSVSKLVGNTNNHSSSGNNNNNNYCVEGLIRKPSSASTSWNDFHLGTSSSSSTGHAHVQSMSTHGQPFVPYQAQVQPDYGNYANFPHHSHSHHHYTNTMTMNPAGHFVHFDHEHTNPGPSSTGSGHNLQQQQQHINHGNNSHQQSQGVPTDSNATISSHHHPHHQQQQQQQHGTSSVLNFNLSSIFPEMNDQRSSSNNNNSSKNNSNVCNYYPSSSTGNISNK